MKGRDTAPWCSYVAGTREENDLRDAVESLRQEHRRQSQSAQQTSADPEASDSAAFPLFARSGWVKGSRKRKGPWGRRGMKSYCKFNLDTQCS